VGVGPRGDGVHDVTDACTSREAEAVLAFLRDAVLRHQWFRAVCLGVELEPRPVGAVSVTPTDDACRAELCVLLARAHWGQGRGHGGGEARGRRGVRRVPGRGARRGARGRRQPGGAAGAGECRVPAGGRAAELLRGQGKPPALVE